ncbi:hypothetical protein ALC62_00227 [Cyphomyrmex costatus]|uniref:Uncharacterized protein n=1 Tax=Cyphomyrmex costatus TaxID=456900 RepID=A0A195D7B8_9HYME|nr:hypothetical protein ALC62_00227 [Cyphomyrmex costatus]
MGEEGERHATTSHLFINPPVWFTRPVIRRLYKWLFHFNSRTNPGSSNSLSNSVFRTLVILGQIAKVRAVNILKTLRRVTICLNKSCFSIASPHHRHRTCLRNDDCLELLARAETSELYNILSTRRSTMTSVASRNLSEESRKGFEKKSQMAVAENRYCNATSKSFRGRRICLHDESADERYLVDLLRDRCL